MKELIWKKLGILRVAVLGLGTLITLLSCGTDVRGTATATQFGRGPSTPTPNPTSGNTVSAISKACKNDIERKLREAFEEGTLEPKCRSALIQQAIQER